MSAQEQMERQIEEQDHSRNFNQAQQLAPSYSDRREYLEAVVEPELEEGSVAALRNMTSKEFILSNLQDAEINEIKKLREITLKKIEALHPDQRAVMKGEVREQVYEDGRGFKSLSQDQRAIIDEFVRGAFADVARSRGGFQQEQFGKVVSASERKDKEEDSGGGLLSFS